jgi:hypothetical protein
MNVACSNVMYSPCYRQSQKKKSLSRSGRQVVNRATHAVRFLKLTEYQAVHITEKVSNFSKSYCLRPH